MIVDKKFTLINNSLMSILYFSIAYLNLSNTHLDLSSNEPLGLLAEGVNTETLFWLFFGFDVDIRT